MHKMKELFEEFCNSDYRLEYSDFILLMKKYDSDKWISVDKNLPPHYESVLVIDDSENVIISEIGGDEERFFESRQPKAPYLEGITHWYPLPKLPIK